MPEKNSLVLNVKSDSVEKGADRLDHLSRASTKAERSQKGLATSSTVTSTAMGKTAATTGAAATSTASYATSAKGATAATVGLSTALKSMIGPLLAIVGPLLLLKKTFSSTVELQDFNAQLKTATGTVENAALAFDALETFASETPYALEQSLKAFITLTNLGLTPSERALQSYGNTASAMGKDLTQLIEAVADATTGEFERLKEFGIKAKSEGDNVSFTFRGVTTTIGKNAAEIEQYLTRIGEVEFAGAMAERMATVGGQVSNFGDLWNQLFRTVSELGAGEVIGESMQVGIDALTEIVGMLESGQFESSIKSWTVAYEGWAEDFADTSKFVSELMALSGEESGEGFVGNFVGSLKTLPIHFRNTVQRGAIELATIVDYGAATVTGLVDVFGEGFISLVDAAKSAGTAIGAALNPFDDTDFSSALKAGLEEQKTIMRGFGEEVAEAYTKAEEGIKATRKARLESLEEINAEFQADIERAAGLTLASDKLRASYEAEKAAKEAARATGASGDALEQFKITPEGAADTEIKAAEKKAAVILKIEKKTTDDKKALQVAQFQNFQQVTMLTATLTGQMADLAEEGSDTRKALFIAQKGISIAQAIINTELGATAAIGMGPLGIPMATAIRALGYASVGVMVGQTVGSFATGGVVPGASYTGDSLTANVNSGEMILNSAQQARLFDIADNKTQTGSGGVNITVENYGSSEIIVEQMSENDIRIIARDQARRVVREDAPSVIASDLQSANSRTSRSLSQNTKTERRR